VAVADSLAVAVADSLMLQRLVAVWQRLGSGSVAAGGGGPGVGGCAARVGCCSVEFLKFQVFTFCFFFFFLFFFFFFFFLLLRSKERAPNQRTPFGV
jgi:hypothetical protein